MGCCGGFIGEVFNPVVDAVKDVGSAIDDAVNDVVPGGWATVAAVTAATMGMPTDFGLGEAAAAEAAGTAAATEAAATGLATLPESVLAADTAFATGSELAAGASPWGISAGAPAAEFGTFNPSTISGIGVQAPELSTLGSLGGTAAMDVGTAGLTAEQLANANLAGSIGSNAASGLGYLGGAESLPSGTAGITGVTSTPVMDSITDAAKKAADLLGGGQQQGGSNTAYLLAKGLSAGQQSSPIGYNMNQNPFTFTAQQPIQGTYNPQTSPLNISDQTKNLANLLRNS
jgi:hypothetical protein